MEARQMLQEEGRRTIADQSYVGALIQKWGEFLEGMPDRTEHQRYVLGCTAMLMENQSQWLQSLTEETRSVNVGSFTKFIFPVMRRVFPNLIANELVSVQPMTAPIGAVFFFDHVYQSTKGPTTRGDVFPAHFDRDYSSEYVNGEQLAAGNGTLYNGGAAGLDAVLSWIPVRSLDTTRGFSVIIKELHVTTGATVQTATDNGTGGFTGNVTAGTINYSNGNITGLKFTAAPAANNPIKAYYYYDGELNVQIPQMKLDIKKSPIEAMPRRLKALWSSEAAEDLRAFHGIDAETEIVSVISQEIAMEIDREIINDLLLNSTGNTASWDRTPPSGISELDHVRSLLTTLSGVSAKIHKNTMRRPANFIVTSPEIAALIAQLTTSNDIRQGIFGGDNVGYNGGGTGEFGTFKVGTLFGKWTVYEDPYMTSNKMLMGLKGDSFLDSGYVFAPYIPLQVTPTFLDPSDFSFRKGLRTRYAKKMIRPDYYAQITITNL